MNLSKEKKFKVAKLSGRLALLAACAYVWRTNTNAQLTWFNFIDDFLLFMTAFMLMQATKQPPERKHIRRQFFLLALLFGFLFGLWIIVLSLKN